MIDHTLRRLRASFETGRTRPLAWRRTQLAAIERMLKKQGVNVYRLGPPVRIGGVLTVACFIEADDVTDRALER